MNKERLKLYLEKRPFLKKIADKVYMFCKRSYILVRLIFLNSIMRLFLRRPKYNKKYNIAICGIFKNEGVFLKEWIEFHMMIGIEHFYLYNNNSEDNYYAILKPYIDKGLVTFVEWPYDHAQMKAYKHFYETYRKETQWVTFLDIDEFICPRYKTSLLEWIRSKDKYPVLGINWRMFGTSGKMHHDFDKLVIEQYTVCWEHLYHVGKCLINTDYDIAVYSGRTHHQTQVKYPLFGNLFKVTVTPANQFGWFVFDPFSFSWLYNENKYSIQINHYWSKAWDIYDKKRQMTDVYFKDNPKKDISYFLWHENQNTETSYLIFRFLTQLKLRLNAIK